MIAIAHFIAISFYLGAAAFAAAPFARPVNAPVRTVAALLCFGIAAHLGALMALRARWLHEASVDEALAVGRKYGLTSLQPQVENLLQSG